MQNISAAIKMLKTYKGLGFFHELENLLNKLEKQVHRKTYAEVQKIVCFEEVPRSCGEEKVNPLMEAILQRQVLRLSYKKYHQEEEKTYLYHPYFLKEYRNRWYVLGWYEAGQCMKTFALDRIITFCARARGDLPGAAQTRSGQLFQKHDRHYPEWCAAIH